MKHMLTVRALDVIAPGDPNPIEGLTQPLITFLQSIAVPAAIVGIMFALIAIILVPLIPSLATQKGYIQTALLCVAAIGFVPGLVAYISGLNGGPSGLLTGAQLAAVAVLPRRLPGLVRRSNSPVGRP